MFSQTSFNNPKFCKRIKRAMWLAKLQSLKTGQRATEYVKNRKGNNTLRIDMLASGELIVYAAGAGMRNYASAVLKALES